MRIVLLFLLLPASISMLSGQTLAPAGGAAAPGSGAPGATQTVLPPRIEKLSSEEQKQLAEAKRGVADAQAKADQASHDPQATAEARKSAQAALDQARREQQGTEDGIAVAHHANTECGCYVQSQGREYDRVEFKDDTIVIRHIHEGPPPTLR